MLTPNEHVLDYVDAYLHEALAPDDARQVEQHCAACKICLVAMDEARKRFEALQSLPPVEASEHLIEATERRIRRAPRFQFRPAMVGYGLAAASVLILAALHVYYASLSPSPWDLRLLGQNQWIADSTASLRVMLVDHRTNRPVPDVPIDIDLVSGGKHYRLASFKTDESGSGSPRLAVPDWPDGDYQLSVKARTGWTPEVITQTLKLRRAWQLMLTTDKPVYQPGQVIHARSLGLRRPDLRPVAGQEIVFSVVDPKGNVILRQRDVTSRFGIASIDCPLATEILEGAYRIQCQAGDTTSAVAVEVKRYVLPKFKIDVELDQPYYEPGQKIHGTVRARYFFGKPVEGAEVKVGMEVGVGWEDGHRRAALVGESHQEKRREKGETTYKTDAQGIATFELMTPEALVGRPQESGDARITLAVSVRDTAGQEQTASVSRTVTTQPIRIEVIPESGTLVHRVENTVYLFTSYPDGRPARTRIAVTGIDRELSTNDMGVASTSLVPPRGPLRWSIRATDGEGRTGRREFAFDAGQGGDFLVRTDRAVYDGGQTMHVLALGGGNGPVFLDLIKDGQTMLTETVEMADGRGTYQVDLPAELFGTIELAAYRYGAAGLPVVKRRVIYVRQAGALRVAAALDHKEYRPGGRAKIALTLTDQAGKAAPGALSLAAVDEAVFSVLSQRPGMEQTFFTLEQELLKPVYAVYPWSPDFASSTGDEQGNRTEQAWFARSASEQGGGLARLKSLLRRYLDGDEQVFRVLERPDWRELAAQQNMPPEVIAMLENRVGSHTLMVRTVPANKEQIEILRQKVSGILYGAWTLVAILGGLFLLLSFLHLLLREAGTFLQVVTAIAIIVLLIGLLTPSIQCAREAGRRVSAMNDLWQIGMAAESAKAANETLEAADTTVVRGSQGAASQPRLRQWFPETLLWRPELITDDNGRATLEVDLADSITTWRLAASAVSAEGKLGAAQTDIRVFQPFFVDLNLPVALTRGDEVAVPAVVYNYLQKPQTVELTLKDADWFERLDSTSRLPGGTSDKSDPTRLVRVVNQAEQLDDVPLGKRDLLLNLSPGEVRSVSFRLRAKRVGRHELRIDARGGEGDQQVADAIQRSVEVVPDGHKVESVTSGTLDQPREIPCDVPADAIEGSPRVIVKIYPSTFSQLVEGLDAVFQQPYGCFEQTSSTTYPNVLALDYLRKTKKNAPEVEAKARQYIHLGYQRLVSFEVPGGGFDWFGHPPAKRTLTAYGLMEFTDMARVHDVDPRLIERTRQWLLAEQSADGSWEPEGFSMHDDPARRAGSDLARLSTTAYIAWAAFAGQPDTPASRKAHDWIITHEPAATADPYVLALAANALRAMRPDGTSARPYLDRLDGMKRSSPDGKFVWWKQTAGGRTMLYGGGRSGSIETTALAALGMIEAQYRPDTTRRALAWLITQKDGRGTWHSTQATVLALNALLAGTGKVLSDQGQRRIEIALDGKTVRQLAIAADQSDVMQQIDLSPQVAGGKHRVMLTEPSGAASGYQVEFSYYQPLAGKPAKEEPLGIDIAYDKTELRVDDSLTATATVVNRMAGPAPMIILDLPIPAGFAVEPEDFAKLAASGTIAKYQLTARSAIVYLRQLAPDAPLVLRYRLQATTPVRVTAAPAQAYEYYDRDKRAASTARQLTVSPRVE